MADFTESSATNFQEATTTTTTTTEPTWDKSLNIRTSSWVDPFEGGCYELNTTPINYDLTAAPKLNFVTGMCGFKIQFSNSHEFAAMSVTLLRDAASTLALSAALATTALALF